jgi:adenosylcobyric acid synthase
MRKLPDRVWKLPRHEDDETAGDEGIGRILALSDGVFAIAITLLIIAIAIPATTSDADLPKALLSLWPRYLAYALSFLVIARFWVTHHLAFRLINRYDATLVTPFTEGLWLDVEDSLSMDRTRRPAPLPPRGADLLRVSVVRLPRISNVTDIDALSAEPGVLVRLATTPAELADADLVVLPGTRATVDDLRWLRRRGLADAITVRAASGRAVLGICGGYQMLGREIDDGVESGAGTVPGLGLLPIRVSFGQAKQLGRPVGSAYGAAVAGYEIHHGIVTVEDAGTTPFPGGCRVAGTWGTSWHGTLENDAFRRAFLTEVAGLAGRDFVAAPDTCFAAVRQAQLDVMGDLVAAHLDTTVLSRLIGEGPPAGLPVIGPAASPLPADG